MTYYVMSTRKLSEFLEKIKSVSRPDKADGKWLDLIGFPSKNYYRFNKILERIGFIDSSGRSTSRWEAYQVPATSKKAMAEGIREGYDILWEAYPDAKNESGENLTKVFQVKLNVNEGTARRAYNTFLKLSEYADFSALGKEIPSNGAPPQAGGQAGAPPAGAGFILTPEVLDGLTQEKRELGVNINIQVTLPETTEAKVYDEIFAALKKHFFSE